MWDLFRGSLKIMIVSLYPRVGAASRGRVLARAEVHSKPELDDGHAHADPAALRRAPSPDRRLFDGGAGADRAGDPRRVQSPLRVVSGFRARRQEPLRGRQLAGDPTPLPASDRLLRSWCRRDPGPAG